MHQHICPDFDCCFIFESPNSWISCSSEVAIRPPATLTTVCPEWYCRSPQPRGKPWRAAHPARSPPAATPWPPHGTGPSSPGSGGLPSLPAGCCPWQAGWGPWAEADPGGASRHLSRAGWPFGLSRRCVGGCTGLCGGRGCSKMSFSCHQNFVELQAKQFQLDLVRHSTTVSYQSHRCCPCSAPGRRPGRTGWSRGGASCGCRRGLGPAPAPRTSPMQALVSGGPACAPDALLARSLSG